MATASSMQGIAPSRINAPTLRQQKALFGRVRAHYKKAGFDGRCESGQALIEAAIVLPVIFAFVFTLIELCLAFYTFCMISESAREGTRYAIVHGATCQTAAKSSCTASASSLNTYVTNIGWPNLGNGTMTASTTFPDGNENPGNRVQIMVNYTFPIQLPFIPKNSIAMASQSTMYFIQ